MLATPSIGFGNCSPHYHDSSYHHHNVLPRRLQYLV